MKEFLSVADICEVLNVSKSTVHKMSSNYLDDKKYLNKVKELLLDLVVVNKEKKKIYILTRIFITELINYGYNASYIYYKTNKFFFNYKNKFKETSPRTFFENFDFKERDFEVVYKVSKLFEEFKNVGKIWASTFLIVIQ